MNGEDKGLVNFKGQPLITHVISAICEQVDDYVISANRNLDRYRQFSTKVISDDSGEHGPLSGIAAALPLCQHDYILVVACDLPFLPGSLVEELVSNIDNSDIAIVKVKQHLQLVFLMKKSLLSSVKDNLIANKHKLMQWVKSHSPTIVDYSTSPQSFRNINSTQDLTTI